MKKAVIDRIVDGQLAILLVGEDETERTVSVAELPEGANEGVWLILHEDGRIEIDQEETTRTDNRIQNKLAMLRSKQGSKFRKS